jgi:hypothetical protein
MVFHLLLLFLPLLYGKNFCIFFRQRAKDQRGTVHINRIIFESSNNLLSITKNNIKKSAIVALNYHFTNCKICFKKMSG